MNELVFLLEEESAREMLKGLLPRLVPSELPVRFMVFEGKQDLEKQLPRRLRGYVNAQARFLVLRDQDANPDCKKVKRRLAALCKKGGRPDAVVRIACREMESFYVGDLAAVERALHIDGLAAFQDKRKYRDPDHLGSPSRELAELTGHCYQKVAGSRAIGPELDPDNHRSTSFRRLVEGIRRLAEGMPSLR
jgi:hypothetical protein